MRMRRKPWTEPLIDSCPFYVDSPAQKRGHWREQFASDAPLHLEIGCGKGVATVKMAHENPGINLIAVDEVRHVLAVSIKNAMAEYGSDPVNNLRFTAIDATTIFDTFAPEDRIERIIINFCNPWPKTHDHKKRLTHNHQLMQYREFLRDGGEIWFKTDNDDLFLSSKRYFGECGFELTYVTENLHNSGFEGSLSTEHEKMFSEQGIPIKFLIAKKIPLKAEENVNEL